MVRSETPPYQMFILVTNCLHFGRTREHGQDGPVRRGEPRPLDLSLQDENLMAKGEDLGVTLVTGYQQQSETGDQEPKQV